MQRTLCYKITSLIGLHEHVKTISISFSCTTLICNLMLDSIISLTAPFLSFRHRWSNVWQTTKQSFSPLNRFRPRGISGRFFYDPFNPNSRRRFYYPRGFYANRRPQNRIPLQGSGFRFPGTALRPPYYGFYAGSIPGFNTNQQVQRLRYLQSIQTTVAPAGYVLFVCFANTWPFL